MRTLTFIVVTVFLGCVVLTCSFVQGVNITSSQAVKEYKKDEKLEKQAEKECIGIKEGIHFTKEKENCSPQISKTTALDRSKSARRKRLMTLWKKPNGWRMIFLKPIDECSQVPEFFKNLGAKWYFDQDSSSKSNSDPNGIGVAYSNTRQGKIRMEKLEGGNSRDRSKNLVGRGNREKRKKRVMRRPNGRNLASHSCGESFVEGEARRRRKKISIRKRGSRTGASNERNIAMNESQISSRVSTSGGTRSRKNAMRRERDSRRKRQKSLKYRKRCPKAIHSADEDLKNTYSPVLSSKSESNVNLRKDLVHGHEKKKRRETDSKKEKVSVDEKYTRMKEVNSNVKSSLNQNSKIVNAKITTQSEARKTPSDSASGCNSETKTHANHSTGIRGHVSNCAKKIQSGKAIEESNSQSSMIRNTKNITSTASTATASTCDLDINSKADSLKASKLGLVKDGRQERSTRCGRAQTTGDKKGNVPDTRASIQSRAGAASSAIAATYESERKKHNLSLEYTGLRGHICGCKRNCESGGGLAKCQSQSSGTRNSEDKVNVSVASSTTRSGCTSSTETKAHSATYSKIGERYNCTHWENENPSVSRTNAASSAIGSASMSKSDSTPSQGDTVSRRVRAKSESQSSITRNPENRVIAVSSATISARKPSTKKKGYRSTSSNIEIGNDCKYDRSTRCGRVQTTTDENLDMVNMRNPKISRTSAASSAMASTCTSKIKSHFNSSKATAGNGQVCPHKNDLVSGTKTSRSEVNSTSLATASTHDSETETYAPNPTRTGLKAHVHSCKKETESKRAITESQFQSTETRNSGNKVKAVSSAINSCCESKPKITSHSSTSSKIGVSHNCRHEKNTKCGSGTECSLNQNQNDATSAIASKTTTHGNNSKSKGVIAHVCRLEENTVSKHASAKSESQSKTKISESGVNAESLATASTYKSKAKKHAHTGLNGHVCGCEKYTEPGRGTAKSTGTRDSRNEAKAVSSAINSCCESSTKATAHSSTPPNMGIRKYCKNEKRPRCGRAQTTTDENSNMLNIRNPSISRTSAACSAIASTSSSKTNNNSTSTRTDGHVCGREKNSVSAEATTKASSQCSMTNNSQRRRHALLSPNISSCRSNIKTSSETGMGNDGRHESSTSTGCGSAQTPSKNLNMMDTTISIQRRASAASSAIPSTRESMTKTHAHSSRPMNGHVSGCKKHTELMKPATICQSQSPVTRNSDSRDNLVPRPTRLTCESSTKTKAHSSASSKIGKRSSQGGRFGTSIDENRDTIHSRTSTQSTADVVSPALGSTHESRTKSGNDSSRGAGHICGWKKNTESSRAIAKESQSTVIENSGSRVNANAKAHSLTSTKIGVGNDCRHDSGIKFKRGQTAENSKILDIEAINQSSTIGRPSRIASTHESMTKTCEHGSKSTGVMGQIRSDKKTISGKEKAKAESELCMTRNSASRVKSPTSATIQTKTHSPTSSKIEIGNDNRHERTKCGGARISTDENSNRMNTRDLLISKTEAVSSTTRKTKNKAHARSSEGKAIMGKVCGGKENTISRGAIVKAGAHVSERRKNTRCGETQTSTDENSNMIDTRIPNRLRTSAIPSAKVSSYESNAKTLARSSKSTGLKTHIYSSKNNNETGKITEKSESQSSVTGNSGSRVNAVSSATIRTSESDDNAEINDCGHERITECKVAVTNLNESPNMINTKTTTRISAEAASSNTHAHSSRTIGLKRHVCSYENNTGSENVTKCQARLSMTGNTGTRINAASSATISAGKTSTKTQAQSSTSSKIGIRNDCKQDRSIKCRRVQTPTNENLNAIDTRTLIESEGSTASSATAPICKTKLKSKTNSLTAADVRKGDSCVDERNDYTRGIQLCMTGNSDTSDTRDSIKTQSSVTSSRLACSMISDTSRTGIDINLDSTSANKTKSSTDDEWKRRRLHGHGKINHKRNTQTSMTEDSDTDTCDQSGCKSIASYSTSASSMDNDSSGNMPSVSMYTTENISMNTGEVKDRTSDEVKSRHIHSTHTKHDHGLRVTSSMTEDTDIDTCDQSESESSADTNTCDQVDRESSTSSMNNDSSRSIPPVTMDTTESVSINTAEMNNIISDGINRRHVRRHTKNNHRRSARTSMTENSDRNTCDQVESESSTSSMDNESSRSIPSVARDTTESTSMNTVEKNIIRSDDLKQSHVRRHTKNNHRRSAQTSMTENSDTNTCDQVESESSTSSMNNDFSRSISPVTMDTTESVSIISDGINRSLHFRRHTKNNHRRSARTLMTEDSDTDTCDQSQSESSASSSAPVCSMFSDTSRTGIDQNIMSNEVNRRHIRRHTKNNDRRSTQVSMTENSDIIDTRHLTDRKSSASSSATASSMDTDTCGHIATRITANTNSATCTEGKKEKPRIPIKNKQSARAIVESNVQSSIVADSTCHSKPKLNKNIRNSSNRRKKGKNCRHRKRNRSNSQSSTTEASSLAGSTYKSELDTKVKGSGSSYTNLEDNLNSNEALAIGSAKSSSSTTTNSKRGRNRNVGNMLTHHKGKKCSKISNTISGAQSSTKRKPKESVKSSNKSPTPKRHQMDKKRRLNIDDIDSIKIADSSSSIIAKKTRRHGENKYSRTLRSASSHRNAMDSESDAIIPASSKKSRVGCANNYRKKKPSRFENNKEIITVDISAISDALSVPDSIPPVVSINDDKQNQKSRNSLSFDASISATRALSNAGDYELSAQSETASDDTVNESESTVASSRSVKASIPRKARKIINSAKVTSSSSAITSYDMVKNKGSSLSKSIARKNKRKSLRTKTHKRRFNSKIQLPTDKTEHYSSNFDNPHPYLSDMAEDSERIIDDHHDQPSLLPTYNGYETDHSESNDSTDDGVNHVENEYDDDYDGSNAYAAALSSATSGTDADEAEVTTDTTTSTETSQGSESYDELISSMIKENAESDEGKIEHGEIDTMDDGKTILDLIDTEKDDHSNIPSDDSTEIQSMIEEFVPYFVQDRKR